MASTKNLKLCALLLLFFASLSYTEAAEANMTLSDDYEPKPYVPSPLIKYIRAMPRLGPQAGMTEYMSFLAAGNYAGLLGLAPIAFVVMFLLGIVALISFPCIILSQCCGGCCCGKMCGGCWCCPSEKHMAKGTHKKSHHWVALIVFLFSVILVFAGATAGFAAQGEIDKGLTTFISAAGDTGDYISKMDKAIDSAFEGMDSVKSGITDLITHCTDSSMKADLEGHKAAFDKYVEMLQGVQKMVKNGATFIKDGITTMKSIKNPIGTAALGTGAYLMILVFFALFVMLIKRYGDRITFVHKHRLLIHNLFLMVAFIMLVVGPTLLIGGGVVCLVDSIFGDVCINPRNDLAILAPPGINFYIACEGDNAIGTQTVETANSFNVLRDNMAALNTAVVKAAKFDNTKSTEVDAAFQNIDDGLGGMFSTVGDKVKPLVLCKELQNLYVKVVEQGTCREMVNGFYGLWVAFFLTGLFTMSLIASLPAASKTTGGDADVAPVEMGVKQPPAFSEVP